MNTDCGWCTSRPDHPAWPDCLCRTECQSPLCLPSFPAAEVKVGMCLHHPRGYTSAAPGLDSGLLDVLAVSEPDAEGFVWLTSPWEVVRVAADWPVTLYTAADADLVASLLMERTGGA